MIPELGHLALILALVLAGIQAGLPLAGTFNRRYSWMATARPLAWGQLTFLTIAFACLVLAFLRDDFSVLYVARNSNTLMPTVYKVSAVWGAHEGSLLLWTLLLGAWGGGRWRPSAIICPGRWWRGCSRCWAWSASAFCSSCC